MIGKALIACEESQAVCIEMRKKGWEAYSCDILPCSGGHPEWHLQMDAFNALKMHKWNIGILHPPCTHTALCSNRWYHDSDLRLQGAKFCSDLWELAIQQCDCVALEQPKTIMQKYIGKKSQVIHPYMFGHKEYKETWLWLKNLPLLKETGNVLKRMLVDDRKEYEKVFRMPPSADRGKLRSKTYVGLAKAMADQWTDFYTTEIIGL